MQTQFNISQGASKKINLLVRYTGAKNRSRMIETLVDDKFQEIFGDEQPDSISLTPTTNGALVVVADAENGAQS